MVFPVSDLQYRETTSTINDSYCYLLS